jgi:hypothetical protein
VSKTLSVIFVPQEGRPRSIALTYAQLRGLAAAIALNIVVSFSAVVALGVLKQSRPHPDSQAIMRDLLASTDQMGRALDKARLAASALTDDAAAKQRELATLTQRYDDLKALTAGQEDIARAHAAILAERNPRRELASLGVAYAVGVLSSLTASALYVLWRRARTLSQEEMARIREI